MPGPFGPAKRDRPIRFRGAARNKQIWVCVWFAYSHIAPEARTLEIIGNWYVIIIPQIIATLLQNYLINNFTLS